jgi:hypothetical protein
MHCKIGLPSLAACRRAIADATGRGRLSRLRTWGPAAALAVALTSTPLSTEVAHAAAVYPSSAPIVGVTAAPDGNGYWEVAADGGIFAYGDARFYGSMGGQHLNAGMVGMAATPDGNGYWEVAADGGIFAYGDARFYGSMGGQHLNGAIVGMAATPDGKGYWLAGADGGVFAYGDARFYGSMADQTLNDPVTGIAAAPSGGYWLTAADGGVFTFGTARFYGSMGGKPLAASVDAITAAPNGGGYWLAAADGGVFAFGTAAYDGRASYTPPRSAPSTTGQLAANLATGWLGLNWKGINTDYWHAVNPPEYWCSDFATYVWQHAGIAVPTYPGVLSFLNWARQNGRYGTDLSHLHVGDVIFYNNGGTEQHVGVVIQVNADGTVQTADGDWGGGTNVSEATFAEHSKVALNTLNPQHGQGAGGTIAGIGLIG